MAEQAKSVVAALGHNRYEITRFNAVKHAVLSRYTVLPWEDAGEYGDLLDALVAEHKPEGPTESHLVEEVAGIFWRKRRLRLAEASAMREGLHRATQSYSDSGEVALVCVSGAGGDVGEALRATPEETEQELRENREAWEAADKALAVLRAGKDDAYESALGALSAGTRDWWLETLEEWVEEPEPEYEASIESLTGWLEGEAITYFRGRESISTHGIEGRNLQRQTVDQSKNSPSLALHTRIQAVSLHLQRIRGITPQWPIPHLKNFSRSFRLLNRKSTAIRTTSSGCRLSPVMFRRSP